MRSGGGAGGGAEVNGAGRGVLPAPPRPAAGPGDSARCLCSGWTVPSLRPDGSGLLARRRVLIVKPAGGGQAQGAERGAQAQGLR